MSVLLLTIKVANGGTEISAVIFDREENPKGALAHKKTGVLIIPFRGLKTCFGALEHLLELNRKNITKIMCSFRIDTS